MSSTIGDLGEFGLIARVTARFPETDDVILGPGDDAAIVSAADQRVVASTDVLVEGRHFRLDWSSARDIGHKAVAQNAADIAAMGARTTALLIGLAAPEDFPVAWAEDFAEGVREECAVVGCTVVGGDTVGSATLTVSVTALGSLDGACSVRRSGARPGDRIAVAGPLGLSAAGLALFQAGLADEDAARAAVAEHRRPAPPYAQGPRAALAGARAMLDVSDGLAQDLGHIAAASGVDIDIRRDALDPAPGLIAAVELLAASGHPAGGAGRPLRDAAADLMVSGGEDHALAAAFPPGAAPPDGWSVIGAVREAAPEGPRVTVDGGPPADCGWDHFSR